MTSWIIKAGTLTAAALLAGCAVTPDYAPPDVAVPPVFSRASGPVETLARPGQGDPMLDRLIDRALAGNLDIKRAAARIAAARAQARIAGAASGPGLNAGAQASVTDLSENSSLGAIAAQASRASDGRLNGAGLPGSRVETYQLGFDAAWELDLFGGAARMVEAARAQVDAAVWSERDAQVMLTAEVSRDYWRYSNLTEQLALLDDAISVRTEVLDYDQARQRNGIATTLDLRRTERDLAMLRTQRQECAAQREALSYALAVLVGEAPGAIIAELGRAPVGPVSSTIPVGLPSELLRRRPDIRSAERRLAAATAQSGAAVAGLYPKLSLTGAANLVSSSLSTLLASGSLQPSAAVAVNLPIFDGGRRKGTVALRQAEADEALIAYRVTVLKALREVEEALTRRRAADDRFKQAMAAYSATYDMRSTMEARARNGLATGRDVLEAKAVHLTASTELAQAQWGVKEDQTALYKALGGGWSDKDITP